MKKVLSLLDSASLAALVVAMCSQVDVRRVGRDTLAEGLGYATKTLAVALSDVVFLAVVLWFIARTVQTRSWRKLWWPPLPCFALLFALVLSALHSGPVVGAVAASLGENGLGPRAFITKESKEAIAEIVQWSAYFLVAPWLFVNLLHDRREDFISRRNLAIVAFAVATLLSGLAALTQLRSFTESAPRGLFSSPHIYGAFLAIAIPVLLENGSPNSRRIQAKLLHFISFNMILVALVTVVSPWALVAAALGMVVAALACDATVRLKAYRLCFVAFFAILGFSFWRLLPALEPYRAAETRVASNDQKVKKQYVEWGAALGWSVPRERALRPASGLATISRTSARFIMRCPTRKKCRPIPTIFIWCRRFQLEFWDWARCCGWWLIFGLWRGAPAENRRPTGWARAWWPRCRAGYLSTFFTPPSSEAPDWFWRFFSRSR